MAKEKRGYDCVEASTQALKQQMQNTTAQPCFIIFIKIPPTNNLVKIFTYRPLVPAKLLGNLSQVIRKHYPQSRPQRRHLSLASSTNGHVVK